MGFFFLENKLIVVRTNASDSGSYKCEAYNSYGSDEKIVNITIEGMFAWIIFGIIIFVITENYNYWTTKN